MLNQVQLIGYIGNVPDLRLTREGKKVFTFSLATHKSWKTPEEEWQTHTEWHQVTLFKESLIPWAEENLTRGNLVFVQGELAYSKWEDTFKQNRRTSHILLAGPASRIIHLKHGKTEQTRMAETLASEHSLSTPQEEEAAIALPSHSTDLTFDKEAKQ